jgi:hypothetical protein
MQQLSLDLQTPVYRGLSDSLHAALDTGNREEVSLVMDSAQEAWESGAITGQQYGDLRDDARGALN